ncbi:hypothetical protein QJS10_CPA05g00254 [Acorus calamus]|uniref:Uncharacterized protein n=1 Tax=Acorus calamus TaxID=4465 RepID=A0AAV9EQ86_ACOCL|nr:hypothetical protein QJS10_CPA05g00254 [Acorus calamus]
MVAFMVVDGLARLEEEAVAEVGEKAMVDAGEERQEWREAPSHSSSNNNSRLPLVYNEVNRYCNSKWHKWRAVLMHNYFSTPWSTMSVVAASIFLIHSLVLAYHHPPHLLKFECYP